MAKTIRHASIGAAIFIPAAHTHIPIGIVSRRHTRIVQRDRVRTAALPLP